MSGLTNNRRILALGMALLLAALATAALLSYVRGVERQAVAGDKTVAVLVARDRIPAGMRAEEASTKGLLGREPVPVRYLADGVITSLTEIGGRVATVEIAKGEQIVAGRFIEPAKVTGVLPIPADRQGMSVDVDVPAGVGGFVVPGNRVSLLAKIEVPAAQGSTTTTVRYIAQDIPVLAVGMRVLSTNGRTPGGEEGENGEVAAPDSDRVQLTLAVTPDQAERIALARLDGELWATLLPNGQKPVSTPGRTKANIFN